MAALRGGGTRAAPVCGKTPDGAQIRHRFARIDRDCSVPFAPAPLADIPRSRLAALCMKRRMPSDKRFALREVPKKSATLAQE